MVLAVIGLVVALKLTLASFPILLLIFVLLVWQVWQVKKDTQEGREQDQSAPPPPPPPKYPRYDPSIRVFIVFFAAVLGFGLKNLLDNTKTYKWLFFLVATLIFLRFLTAAANNLWLEYLKYERDPQPLDFFVGVGFFWITVFGCFGAYLCYADGPREFFLRALLLLCVTLVGSVPQWLCAKFKLTTPIGQWGSWFSLVNGAQLAAVVVYWWAGGVLGLTWADRLINPSTHGCHTIGGK